MTMRSPESAPVNSLPNLMIGCAPAVPNTSFVRRCPAPIVSRQNPELPVFFLQNDFLSMERCEAATTVTLLRWTKEGENDDANHRNTVAGRAYPGHSTRENRSRKGCGGNALCCGKLSQEPGRRGFRSFH